MKWRGFGRKSSRGVIKVNIPEFVFRKIEIQKKTAMFNSEI